MGGDAGPAVVVPGAAIALERHPGVRFLLFGDEARIKPHLQENPALLERSTVVHTDAVVEMRDKGDLTFAIRASVCLPAFYVPVRDPQGRLLVDGGLVANLPISYAWDLGADIVIAVDVGADGAKVSLASYGSAQFLPAWSAVKRTDGKVSAGQSPGKAV